MATHACTVEVASEPGGVAEKVLATIDTQPDGATNMWTAEISPLHRSGFERWFGSIARDQILYINLPGGDAVECMVIEFTRRPRPSLTVGGDGAGPR